MICKKRPAIKTLILKVLISTVMSSFAFSQVAVWALENSSLDNQLKVIEDEYDRHALTESTLEELARLVLVHPTNYRVHLYYGLALDEVGLAEQAMEQFQLADKYGPQDPRGTAGVLSHLISKGDNVTASIMLEKALVRFPNSPEILLLFGRTLKDQKHFQEATRVLTRAYDVNCRNHIYRLPSELGELLLRANPVFAVQLAREDLAKNPNFYLALQVEGASLMQMGLYKQALAPLAKLYEQNHNFANSAQLYCRCLYWNHDYKKGLVPSFYYLAKEGTHPGLGLGSADVALAFVRGSSRADAVSALKTFYEEVSAAKVALADAFHFYMGLIFYKCRMGDLALEELDKYLALNPKHVESLFLKARIEEVQLLDYEHALADYRLASALSPYNLEYQQAMLNLEERLAQRNRDWAWCLRDWLAGLWSRK